MSKLWIETCEKRTSGRLSVFFYARADEVVEYALSRTLSPALIAEYQTQLPDKELLQAKLHELLQDAPQEQ